MKKIYYAALMYMLLGLGTGLFFRTYTHANEFNGHTELAVMHTHLLALGMLFFLIVLGLAKQFNLSGTKWFNLFFWHYNAGLLLTTAMMFVIGLRDVAGQGELPMLNGIAGLGHIILSAGLVFFFVALNKALTIKSKV